MIKDYQVLEQQLLGSWEYISDIESFLMEAPLAKTLTMCEIINLFECIESIRSFDRTHCIKDASSEGDFIIESIEKYLIDSHISEINKAYELAMKAGLINYEDSAIIEIDTEEGLGNWKVLPKKLPNINIKDNKKLVSDILKQFKNINPIDINGLIVNSATLVLVFETHMITYKHCMIETEFNFFDGPDDEASSNPMYLTYNLKELNNEMINNITVGMPVQIICY